MFDINGWEFLLLLIIGIVVLGPERLPDYAAKLARLVRQVKAMAQEAQHQLKEQMGPDFDDVDWKRYDPRQYDPRRIVREALMENPRDEVGNEVPPELRPMPGTYDSNQPTPWDPDAT